MVYLSRLLNIFLTVKEIKPLTDELVFTFKVIPRMMLNCTAEYKDVRYCVSRGTCGKNVAAIQCYGEPNRQNLRRCCCL